MKVLFIVADPDKASTRVRVRNLLPELERAGLRCETAPWPRGWRARRRLAAHAARHDRVVLQKILPGAADLHMLRRRSRWLAYDFDDAVFLRGGAAGTAPGGARARRFRRLCRHADLMLAGNAWLASAAAERGGTVKVLPSAVPVRSAPRHLPRGGSRRPVVGWVGSSRTLPYLESVLPALRATALVRPFRLHVICDRPARMPGLDMVHVPWSEDTQAAAVAQLDVGLMPLPDTPWARGKCAYKLLQYMAAGVPFVASAVGMNVEVADGERSGLLAPTPGDFAAPLLRLLGDPGLRTRLGQHGHALALRAYDVPVVAAALATVLRAGGGEPEAAA